jgi:hypothetical protein
MFHDQIAFAASKRPLGEGAEQVGVGMRFGSGNSLLQAL